MATNQALSALHSLGQAVWIDNLSRELVASGELSRLIGQGVRGLTSNPTIFKKAIADTAAYDGEITALGKKGMGVEEITETLMVAEVGAAADLFLPLYREAHNGDGCVSIEVSPTLARDTAGTIASAEKLWKALARPNVMIKIPATPEGLPAIEEVLARGINVNVTLIFSDEVYRQVAERYLAALERRANAGASIKGIYSVASFFVSRVDAAVSKELDGLVKQGKVAASITDTLFGKVGVANSRRAYRSFCSLFSGARWEKLAALGAVVQRPLWASTGTKDPRLSPTLYVEELAGPHTVNTMPPATLDATMVASGFKNRLEGSRQSDEEILATLGSSGVDLDRILRTLVEQGVVLFADSYRELLESVSAKRAAVSR